MDSIKYLNKNGVPEIQINAKRGGFRTFQYIYALIMIPILFYVVRPSLFYSWEAIINSPILILILLMLLINIYISLWYLIGKERITFLLDELHYKKDILGFGILRKYKVFNIKNLKLASISYGQLISSFQFFEIFYFAIYSQSRNIGMVLSFEYGNKTKYFGFNLKESEAEELLEKIEEYINRGYTTP